MKPTHCKKINVSDLPPGGMLSLGCGTRAKWCIVNVRPNGCMGLNTSLTKIHASGIDVFAPLPETLIVEAWYRGNHNIIYYDHRRSVFEKGTILADQFDRLPKISPTGGSTQFRLKGER